MSQKLGSKVPKYNLPTLNRFRTTNIGVSLKFIIIIKIKQIQIFVGSGSAEYKFTKSHTIAIQVHIQLYKKQHRSYKERQFRHIYENSNILKFYKLP